jgi:tetratricopeptide (TPR) repeat protein
MARKVLEVFLSSTAQDLAPHREAVYERLRRVEFFQCVRQEDFGAQDSDAFCRKRAQAADLFIGLIGMRRGWEPEGDNAKRSITEMEYDWAKEAGRRPFVYISPETFPVPGNLRETSAEHQRLLAFRTRIMGEQIVSQKGFASPELFASEIVERLLAYVVVSDLISELRPELVRRDATSVEDRRPAVAAAVERLAEDEDVDLLALAKDPKNVDLVDLESKLKTRAEAHEAEGQSSIKTSAEYWRHIGALAFLHNTRKSVLAYEKAVALDPLEPEGWHYLGELQYRLGDVARAEQSFDRVLALGKSTGDLKVQAIGCVRLGWIFHDRGDLARADTLIADAVRFAELAEWQEGLARAYVSLGILHSSRGDLDKAEEMQRKALTIEEALASKEGMARAFANLGVGHATRGDLDKAEEMFRKSLALSEELGSKAGMASAHAYLGAVHLIRGDLDKAEEMFRKDLALSEELSSKAGMAAACGNLGNINQTRGDLDKAEEMYRTSLAFSEELSSKAGMAGAYTSLGAVHQTRGDLDKAEEMYRKSLKLNEELGSREGMAHASSKLGIIYQNKGDKAAMCECWRKARNHYRKMGLPNEVAKLDAWLKQGKCGKR